MTPSVSSRSVKTLLRSAAQTSAANPRSKATSPRIDFSRLRLGARLGAAALTIALHGIVITPALWGTGTADPKRNLFGEGDASDDQQADDARLQVVIVDTTRTSVEDASRAPAPIVSDALIPLRVTANIPEPKIFRTDDGPDTTDRLQESPQVAETGGAD